jgi:hypothetical protein
MSTINIAIGQTPPAASTTVAAGSNNARLPQATINVASTTGFSSSGSFIVQTDEGPQEVFYTGTTGTSFTGCTGGIGKTFTGMPVTNQPSATAQGGQQPSAPVINIGLDIAAGSDYAAGGYAFDPSAQLQLLAGYDKAPQNVAVLSEDKIVSAHTYRWAYDRVAGKLILLKDGADAGTADQSAVGSIRVLVMAR